MLLNAFIYFSRIFFVVFHHKICVFIIFICFFDEASNFCNRILTDQKRELVVSNCQWNCMFYDVMFFTFTAFLLQVYLKYCYFSPLRQDRINLHRNLIATSALFCMFAIINNYAISEQIEFSMKSAVSFINVISCVHIPFKSFACIGKTVILGNKNIWALPNIYCNSGKFMQFSQFEFSQTIYLCQTEF